MNTIIYWFRQDLRLKDNPALYEAVQQAKCIIPVYILDDNHSNLGSAQKWWLHHSLLALQNELSLYGLKLILKRGDTQKILDNLIKHSKATAIYCNKRYEPTQKIMDDALKQHFLQTHVNFKAFSSYLLFEPMEINNKQGSYYKVFTYFMNHCRSLPFGRSLLGLPHFKLLAGLKAEGLSSDTYNTSSSDTFFSEPLESWNLLPTHPNWAVHFSKYWKPGELAAQHQLKQFITQKLIDYADKRDFPDEDCTSHLSPYLHFGEITPLQIMQAVKAAEDINPKLGNSIYKFTSELYWREFSYYLLTHFPELPHKNFQAKFDHFSWGKNKKLLTAWQKGLTGYPIIDAGMRQLWKTGTMHNRVRMIVASLLTKNMFIHWREGADWFLDTLLDADLAANSLNWQWVAGSGPDASPFFRIFNPTLQSKKFDPEGKYILTWVPELAKLPMKYIHAPWEIPKAVLDGIPFKFGKDYPLPVVDYNATRQQALAMSGHHKKLGSPKSKVKSPKK